MRHTPAVGDLVRFTAAWLRSGHVPRARIPVLAGKVGTVVNIRTTGNITALEVLWRPARSMSELANADVLEIVAEKL